MNAKRKYTVSVEFDVLTTHVMAHSEGEARRIVRQKVRDGKLRPKITSSKYSGCGNGVIAELSDECGRW